ncbi:hypothetical protein CRENPOLYSF1_1540022 [Crenothrix polyspora]|uniref:Uncharacterized protein n=1 Tax=Crenothrix polyspora TaxID=360316 RepID=A0A1R4H4K6_9GAMM|nr:hypothetical protein CRENPOLYSF1_1540022 [Crenothrix polyspora]
MPHAVAEMEKQRKNKSPVDQPNQAHLQKCLHTLVRHCPTSHSPQHVHHTQQTGRQQYAGDAVADRDESGKWQFINV